MYYDVCPLKHDPFAERPDPEFLFPSPSHKAALQALRSGIEAGQELLALFGAPGLGKTTVLRACQVGIRPLSQMIFIGYPKLSFRDVLALICQECGLDCATDSPAAMLSHLYQTLQAERQSGWRIVLLIDEAHHLPVQTLESFFHLFVLQAATREKLFQIVLAGLPELQHTLNLPQLHALKKHLAVRVTLAPLTSEESRAYICHRLTKALMLEDELFTSRALKQIIRHARGNPRVLNTLCSNALITASLSRQQRISAALVREVVADLGTKNPRPYKRWATVAAVGLLLAAGVLWGRQFADLFHGLMAEQPVEEPGLSPPAASVASPAQDVTQQTQLSVLPQGPIITTPRDRPAPRLPEQEAAERTTQAPHGQPRRVPSGPSTPREAERGPAEVAAGLTPSEPVAPPPQAANRPEPALPSRSSSGPSMQRLKALDRALRPEPETVESVNRAPAETPRQAPAVPPRPEAILSKPGATASPDSPPAGRRREHAVTTPDRDREVTQARVHRTAAMPTVQTVNFHSLPEAATVFINGKMVGITPVRVQLPLGSHTVLIEKRAYTSIHYRLNIDRAGENNLYHDLYEDAHSN
jgi:type II secretory pathway predicted ATPase ExeA